MNKKGQKGALGFALVVVAFVYIIASFGLIPIFNETLDDARDTTSLNCPGTPSFDSTDYNNDTAFEKLVKRPTCFATGFSMVYFIGAFVIAVMVWVLKNWRTLSK